MSDLDASLAALADPTRRAILARLALGEATVNELAEPFDDDAAGDLASPQGARRRGLIVARIEGTKRPCRAGAGAISEIDRWLGMLRKALSANYDRLDEVWPK